MFDALFLNHPRSVGESYGEHLTAALGFAGRLSIAAIACFVHALVPALFQRTGSRIVTELQIKMVANRRRQPINAGEFDYAI